jgi:hypothetical protein
MTNSEIVAALISLRPKSVWSLSGDDLSGLAWSDPVQVRPSDAEILAEVARLASLPPRYKVRKSTIISRLTDAQLSQAISMLTVRQQERWRAPDQPAVNADDAETIAIVKAVGADPAVVMAPE